MQGLKLRETDIIRIARESIDALSRPDSVSIALDVSGLTNPAVWLDHAAIAGALTDLAQNALDAMPGGGRLSITVGENEDKVSITVEDTGCGISKENMDLILTPFFTTKPVGEGTGLGLPAAYGIVKAHSGELTVTSNSDPQCGPTGTRIQITLPRRLILADRKASLIIHEE